MGDSKAGGIIPGAIGAVVGLLAGGGNPMGAVSGYQMGSSIGSGVDMFTGGGQQSQLPSGGNFNPLQGAGTVIKGSKATKSDKSAGLGGSDGLNVLAGLLTLVSGLGSGSNQQVQAPPMPPLPQFPAVTPQQPNINIDSILQGILMNRAQPLPFNQGRR